MYIYIYIYRKREREREREGDILLDMSTNAPRSLKGQKVSSIMID